MQWSSVRALTPQRLLIGVAALYVVTQFVVVTPRMYVGWDEAVYLSQLAPGVPPMLMTAPRALGTQLLAAPVAAFTASATAVRLYLMLLSGPAVVLAFRPWLRLRPGHTVPLAALLFCGLWLTIFYGNAVMPNFAVACAAVAAVAYFLSGSGLGLAVCFGVMALIRPTDAVWMAAPLLAGALIHRAWRRPAGMAAIGAGLAIGWVPWLVESYVRFGGPLERLRLIDQENGNGLHLTLWRQLESFSSATASCLAWQPCGRISATGVFAWATLLGLTGAALWRHRRADTVLLTGTALGFAAPYLFMTGIANPRFLLPAYALLALPSAEALAALAGARRLGPAAAVALIGVFLTGQLATASTISDRNYRIRLRQAHIAGRLHAIGIRPPCLVYGVSAAAVGYATRCTAWPTQHGLPASPPAVLLRRAAAGTQVVALDVIPARPAWRHRFQHIRVPAHQPWYAYVTLPGELP